MAIKHTVSYLKNTSKGVKTILETRNLTRSKAIRIKCMDCAGGQMAEVRECHIVQCSLWPFRMGTKPMGLVTDTVAIDLPGEENQK